MPDYLCFFLCPLRNILQLSLCGTQSRFDTNNIKAEKVLSSKEVRKPLQSTPYLPESLYKMTLLLLHTVSASPAEATDV